jgi:hypothetical protein
MKSKGPPPLSCLSTRKTMSEQRNFEEQLLVGELTRRMNNEFAAAIAVVSLAAARSPDGEVKRGCWPW